MSQKILSKSAAALVVLVSLSGCTVGDRTIRPVWNTPQKKPTTFSSDATVVSNTSSACNGINVVGVKRAMYKGYIPYEAIVIKNTSNRRTRVMFDVKIERISRNLKGAFKETYWKQVGPTIIRPDQVEGEIMVQMIEKGKRVTKVHLLGCE